MRIAILGCGYVANMYRLTLGMHPELHLVGVFDTERSRTETMAELTGARPYKSFDEMLADERVQTVLNLTNPSEHFHTTHALLEAGKHVYSEKPLAMSVPEAQQLATFARQKGLMLVSAPCTLLSPVAQTVWSALKGGKIGRVRLVHAEMEDGMVARAPYPKWINEMGIAWPAVDEFETGCTIEHAGYVLTWLCAVFGPVVRVMAESAELMPDKILGLEIRPAPDYSVAVLHFSSGVVARLTNGLYASHDHTLSFFGDDGVLSVDDPRSDTSAVRVRQYKTIRRRRFLSPMATKLPLLGKAENITPYRGSQTRDFCRSVTDMARALEEGGNTYMDAQFALHITEVTLACHFGSGPGALEAGITSMPYIPASSFEPMELLSWAI